VHDPYLMQLLGVGVKSLAEQIGLVSGFSD